MIEEQKKVKAATDFFFAACLSIYWEKNLTIAEDMTDAVSSTSFLHLFAVCCFDTWL